MKKDIYIIKNDINDKVYIGQAKDTRQRWKNHCTFSKKSIRIDKEIHKMGKEHFWYEILESQIENYDEREKYWIAYYNSYNNGYNDTKGGQDGSSPSGINNSQSSIQDKEILNNILYDLKYTDLLQSEIAQKYNISSQVVTKINQGRSYSNPNFIYPIREDNSYKSLTKKQSKEIKELIKTSQLTFLEIAKKYNISSSYVGKINRGEVKKDENDSYPLRKGRSVSKHLLENQIDTIYDLLINSNLSLRKISKQVNVPQSTVQQIKNGTIKLYRKEGYNYPLRSNNFKKPVSTISAKESTTTIDT